MRLCFVNNREEIQKEVIEQENCMDNRKEG